MQRLQLGRMLDAHGAGIEDTMAESTSMSPAHVLYGQSLRMPIDHLNSVHPVQAAQDQVHKWEDIKKMVQIKL